MIHWTYSDAINKSTRFFLSNYREERERERAIEGERKSIRQIPLSLKLRFMFVLFAASCFRYVIRTYMIQRTHKEYFVQPLLCFPQFAMSPRS